MALLRQWRADITSIKRHVGISRPAIYKGIDKAPAAGAQAGLKDTYRNPKAPEILDDAKAWVVSLACTKPKDHDLAAELWTLSALARTWQIMRKRLAFSPFGECCQVHGVAYFE